MSELEEKARAAYERIRDAVDSPENRGRVVVIDLNSGEYEVDTSRTGEGIGASLWLQEQHPDADLWAFRIGFRHLETLGGMREADPQ